ncbi:MAG: deoxyribose-phosphate aldolase [Bacillota bacterium]|nr:deoxyribose-phosphate aldolase [Bacillota bacterium]
MKKFSKYFDHTLLKPDAAPSDVLKLVTEAIRYDCASICVNGSYVRSARRFRDASGSDVKICAVAGFPLGAIATNAKAYEVQLALEDGAEEIDLVMNIGQAKAGNWAYVEDEIYAIGEMCHEDGAIIKVIIETCLLTNDEIVKACQSAEAAGADFVKTSTGFGASGAKVEDVELMKQTVGDRLQVKASGGIRTLDDAKAMLAAGADRLGCSASVEIIEAFEETQD